jgi:antirestriction protein ArdC
MEKRTTAEIIAEMIATMLDKGISPWHKPWTNGTPCSINGNAYRGWNAILLGFLPYKDNRYLTFNKVKAMGGTVNKGEKSHFVYFWQFIEKEVIDKETGKKEKIKFPFAKGYRVFNVEQCNIPNLKPCKDYHHENNPIETAEKVWENYKNKPELFNGNSAYYDMKYDYISIPDIHRFDNSDAYYATLFHEAIHSTGAKHRLDRDMKSYSQDKNSYGYEELVAEIGSQLLCQSIGITRTLENSASYCKSWANAIKQMPAKAVLSAAGTAQKAVDYILGNQYNVEETE